ncbi:hypothetical protein DF185_20070 [Marinifilum breve]|uniref:Uncharacterized protein n=1 Tax=Marinifilum breve TaxID=2184082 RepID=A0A2V3ZSV3_9BACT|nr:hypothetical protein [Marinifilum breve]PXX96938.1 hypothetical protein DF185_20070 [Marinifilum breve]
MQSKMYKALSIISLLMNVIGFGIMLLKLYLIEDLPIVFGILFITMGASLSSMNLYFRKKAKVK